MTTPTDQTLHRTRPFTDFCVVSIEHLRRVLHAYRARLLIRTPGPVPYKIIHHFKSDLINNMDHKRISGTEPSSVILRQIK